MKKTVCKVTASALMLSLLFSLVSCGGSAPCAMTLLEEFSTSYGIDGAKYYSECASDEDGYIDDELWESLFILSEPPDMEYALLLHSKLDTVCEVVVFVSDNAETRYLLTDVIAERLDFLAASSFVGEGFTVRSGYVTVYGFLPDASRARAVLSELIG